MCLMVKTLVVMQRCVSLMVETFAMMQRDEIQILRTLAVKEMQICDNESSAVVEKLMVRMAGKKQKGADCCNTADKGVCMLVAKDLSVAGCKVLRKYKDVWLAGDEAHDKSVCL